MDIRILILIVSFLFASCNSEKVDASKISMSKFEKFKAKEKFAEDSTLFYPGISDITLLPVLSRKINQVADNFEAISKSQNPTANDYQEEIKRSLELFNDVSLSLDTEDRERICLYFEELMDIVGLKSSGGHLNNFMYGFDPTVYKK